MSDMDIHLLKKLKVQGQHNSISERRSDNSLDGSQNPSESSSHASPPHGTVALKPQLSSAMRSQHSVRETES
eukprot:1152956-Pelagomonas_calceolata.AAC.4